MFRAPYDSYVQVFLACSRRQCLETLTQPRDFILHRLYNAVSARIVTPFATLQEDLRRRRLAREGGERERQIRLLAEREMAGKPLPDDRSRSYNNQYNAPAARQNRGR